MKMVFHDIRFYSVSLLIGVIAPIFAHNEHTKWFKHDEVSPSNITAHFGNRRTVNRTSTSPHFSQTTRHAIPPAVEVSIRRTRTLSPSKNQTYNPADEMAEFLAVILENFGKYITSNGSSKEKFTNESFVSVLMLEIFTMSTGNHFVIPPTEDKQLEEKQQGTAWALSQLFLDLSCAEDVYAILKNVTIGETVIQYNSTGKLQAVNEIHEVLGTLLNKLNDSIEENYFLSSKYKAERIRYLARQFHGADTQLKVYVPLDDAMRGAVDRGALKAWMNDQNLRKCFIHGYVLEMRKYNALQCCNKGDENRVWARTILKVAKEECCIAKMQKLYTAALNETATNFDVVLAYQQRVIRFLVDKVNKSIEVDSVLKNTWTKLENEVRVELRREEGERRFG